MKKRTVITTEKREVWVIRHASEIPVGVAQAPETDSWEPASSSESLTALPEQHPDKKKITVQRETFERVRALLRRANNSSRFCLQCSVETNYLTLDQAVSLARIGVREMMRRVEAQELHALETTSGHLLICQNSLNAG